MKFQDQKYDWNQESGLFTRKFIFQTGHFPVNGDEVINNSDKNDQKDCNDNINFSFSIP